MEINWNKFQKSIKEHEDVQKYCGDMFTMKYCSVRSIDNRENCMYY